MSGEPPTLPGGPGSREPDAQACETLVGTGPGPPAGPATGPTRAGPGEAPGADPAQAFPVAGWTRYQLLGFVGEGGMGRVYRALDPRLGRTVALKFVRGDDPDLTRRFLQEARAQARVDHENVCPVYEAGEVGGRLYIAMPLIAGAPLSEAARLLSREEKVEVVRQVAEGLHAAHRIGLVHRDVKPANVMVEEREDGRLHPYVMDFGLVRDTAAEGLTLSGSVVGTAWYMSPEQVLGNAPLVDRRSDVYSVGATLYEVLSGDPPFGRGGALEVMRRIVDEEAVPLERRLPGFPRDLSTIVSRCLEKDPARRYDSARALADDLRRFLDGEPIAARPQGRWERLARRARRNPALTAALVALAVAVSAFGTYVVASTLESRRRAEVARALGEEMRENEVLVRFASHLLPEHDVGREREIVRARLAELERRLPGLGPTARAPGAYALGRGFLVLGDLDRARRELDAAWQLGFRTPDVAYARGLALAGLFERERRAFTSLATPEERERRREELAATLRRPALEALRLARGARMDSPLYAEALVADLEDDHDRAAALARRAAEGAPWLYEAQTLLGRVLRRRGRAAMDEGDDARALADFALAEEAYLAAVDVARSDPLAHQGLCSLSRDLVDFAQQRRRSPAEAFAKAARWCESAVKVDPGNGLTLLRASDVEWQWGIHLASRGEDPRARLHRAVELAERTLPSRFDPAYAYDNMGIAWVNLAVWESQHGLDPLPSLGKAEAVLERCVTEFPNLFSSHCNLGESRLARARWERLHGRDPSDALGAARAALARGERFTDHFCVAAGRLAAESEAVRWAVLSGSSPGPPAAEAERWAGVLRRRNGSVVEGPLETARVALALAERALLSGEPPAEPLGRARSALAEAVQLGAEDPEVALVSAEAALLEARAGRASWDDAASRLERARLLLPGSARALAASARLVHFRDAARPVPPAALREGLRLAQQAAAIDPGSAEAHLLAGRFLARLGRAEASRESLARGRELNPLLPRLLGLGPRPGRPRS